MGLFRTVLNEALGPRCSIKTDTIKVTMRHFASLIGDGQSLKTV